MARQSFVDLQITIENEVSAHPHLRAIRGYNHTMVAELGKVFPLRGKAMLDLGASIHGYALEAALEAGVQSYEGVDLDISRHWAAPLVEFVAVGGGRGRLQEMNAEALEFDAGAFDCLLSISTFEHFLRPEIVLEEMFRVLRPGGVALLSFEPIWTAAYGHHLHHFGALSDLVPPWSHLYLTEEQMRAVLVRAVWPADAPLSLDGSLQWIYHGSGINRLDIRELRQILGASRFEVAWIQPLADERVAPSLAEYVSRLTAYSRDELLTRGLSVLLRKSFED